MRRVIAATAAALLLLAHAPAPARADTAAEQAATQVVKTLVDNAHSAMVAKDTAKLKQAISKAFAFDVWERFLVGDRGLTTEQRATFRNLLPGFLAHLYADQFGNGLDSAPKVDGAQTVRRDVLVTAEIPRASGGPLPVEYRLRDFADRGPLVIDIMVGGVSFLVLKRDEFGSILKKGGAPALLDFMRKNSI